MPTQKALQLAKLGPSTFFKRCNNVPTYKGKIQGVILDWSGTTADAHVLAPATAFIEVFKRHNVPITMQEARGPMGIRKDLHIAQILELPDVKERWKKANGEYPDSSLDGKDVKSIYGMFEPVEVEILPNYTKLLPGIAESLTYLQKECGIKVGSTTGFMKVMVDILLRDAAKQGYVPDSSVAGDQVINNLGFRPAPFMLYKNLLEMAVWPIQSVVKVDDTSSGIKEGLNAGCWSVGVAAYSNYTAVASMDEWNNLSENEKQKRVQGSREKLEESGAHYVIDGIWQLPLVIEEINVRLASGDKP